MRTLLLPLSLGLLAFACTRSPQQSDPKWIEFGIEADPATGASQPTASLPYYSSSRPTTDRVNVLTPLQRWRVGSAQLTIDEVGFPALSIALHQTDAGAFEAFTAANVDRPLVTIIEGKVASVAFINEKLPGEFQISGRFTEVEAKHLVDVLR